MYPVQYRNRQRSCRNLVGPQDHKKYSLLCDLALLDSNPVAGPNAETVIAGLSIPFEPDPSGGIFDLGEILRFDNPRNKRSSFRVICMTFTKLTFSHLGHVAESIIR